ncbi:MAG: HEPN domain-containing protein [Ilumatobacteraceae bacterium]
MTWARGRAEVERLLADGELERVPPSQEVVDRLLADVTAHIRLARRGTDDDPAGAMQLSYDAARKACTALMAVQGLRATSRGGHIAVIDTVRAQFNDRGGMAVFGRLHRLRRRRNATEYPDLDSPGITQDDAGQAIDTAREVIGVVERLLASGRLDAFR